MLMNSQAIQQELLSIVLRFGTHMCNDSWYIQHMLINLSTSWRLWSAAHAMVKFCWRATKTKTTSHCYSTALISFLETRCLNQLASEEVTTYPHTSEVICCAIHVEDTFTELHSLSEAQKLQEEIIYILVKGDLPLLKWCVSHLAVLEGIPGHLSGSQFPFNFSHYDGLNNFCTFMVCFTGHISVKDKCQTSSWFCHEENIFSHYFTHSWSYRMLMTSDSSLQGIHLTVAALPTQLGRTVPRWCSRNRVETVSAASNTDQYLCSQISQG